MGIGGGVVGTGVVDFLPDGFLVTKSGSTMLGVSDNFLLPFSFSLFLTSTGSCAFTSMTAGSEAASGATTGETTGSVKGGSEGGAIVSTMGGGMDGSSSIDTSSGGRLGVAGT